jgi:hypothetical protein
MTDAKHWRGARTSSPPWHVQDSHGSNPVRPSHDVPSGGAGSRTQRPSSAHDTGLHGLSATQVSGEQTGIVLDVVVVVDVGVVLEVVVVTAPAAVAANTTRGVEVTARRSAIRNARPGTDGKPYRPGDR